MHTMRTNQSVKRAGLLLLIPLCLLTACANATPAGSSASSDAAASVSEASLPLTEEAFLGAVEAALGEALFEEEILLDIALRDGELRVSVDINGDDFSIYPKPLFAKARANTFANHALCDPGFDIYWDTIVIDMKDIGSTTHRKADLTADGDNRSFPDTELIPY